MLSSPQLRGIIVTIINKAGGPVPAQSLFHTKLLSTADDREAILAEAKAMLEEGLLKETEVGLLFLP